MEYLKMVKTSSEAKQKEILYFIEENNDLYCKMPSIVCYYEDGTIDKIYDKKTFSASDIKDKTTLIGVKLSNNIDNIANMACYGCSEIKFAHIPNSVNSIGSLVFNDCQKLSLFKLPSNITKIESRAFYNCKKY